MQFFNDITSAFRKVDEEILNKYLSNGEAEYFFRLRKAEMLHLINVVKSAEELIDDDDKKFTNKDIFDLKRVTLLHDIGKSVYRLGPIKKSLVVLFGKKYKNDINMKERFKSLDIYFNHPIYSVDILKQTNSFIDNPIMYDMILYHHEPHLFYNSNEQYYNDLFKIFIKADSLN